MSEAADAIRGEASMLREQLQVLREREARLLRDLRDTMEATADVRVRLNHVNNRIEELKEPR